MNSKGGMTKAEWRDLTEGAPLDRLDITHTAWSDVRSAIIRRAFENGRREGVAYYADPVMIRLLEAAADEVLTSKGVLRTLSGTRYNRLISDLRVMLTEERVPNTVKGVEMAPRKNRANIVVMTIEGQVLAAPKPGMDEINMNDTATQVREEAAAAGVEVRPAENDVDPRLLDRNGRKLTGQALTSRQAQIDAGTPIGQPKRKSGTCLYSGQPTSGGRFITGADAKLKSALLKRFRDESVDIGRQFPDMSDENKESFASGALSTSQGAYDRAVELGWEAHMKPGKVKAPPVTDGLGTGNYTVKDEDGVLLQRVANDEAAIAWIEENDYEHIESEEHGIVVAAIDSDDEGNESDEE